jgi:hypothetical protein
MSYPTDLLKTLMAQVKAQSAYSHVATNPNFGDALDPPWDGFEVMTAGDVQVLTAANDLVTISAQTGRIYPVSIKGIIAASTTVAASDIVGYAE